MSYRFFIIEAEGAKAVVWARDTAQAREAAVAMSSHFRHEPVHTSEVFNPTQVARAHVLMCATEDNMP